MKAYKGFDLNMCCRGYQFAVGQIHTHAGDVVPCKSGFHACLKATEVWKYYGPAESRYAEVEMAGTTKTQNEDSKIAASELRVVKEISAKDFLALVIAEIFDGANSSKLAASGHSSKLAASGHYSQLAASGIYSQLAASGDYSQLAASGNYSVIASACIKARAKGGNGTWISLAEFVNGKCIGFATGCIGIGGLDPDVWYVARGGKLIKE